MSDTQKTKRKEFIQAQSIHDIRRAIPSQLFHRDEARFLVSVGYSLSLTLCTAYLAYHLLPLKLWALPFWVLYALFNGTNATGLWVLAHECGHGAFSKSRWKNDALGFLLHSGLLVPYFSWQYSHFVHHNHTNHVSDGETHVPDKIDTPGGQWRMRLRDKIGLRVWGLFNLIIILMLGWLIYLFFGGTGGKKRGITNHFFAPNKLFPKKMILRVFASTLGVGIMLGCLVFWAKQTSFIEVLALYMGPYLVVNAWLVGYTWLHHTDIDIPYYEEGSWNWLKGALCSVDRNYPEWINALHFDIGSTHVVHHLFSYLPHYHAREATEAIKKVLGSEYRYDKRPVWKALWEAAKLGAVEETEKGTWKYITNNPYFRDAEQK